MKSIVIFALFITGIIAEPIGVANSNVTKNAGRNAQIMLDILQRLLAALRDNDPTIVNSVAVETNILGLLPAGASVHGLQVSGFGNIIVNSVSYGGVQASLDVDVPEIVLSLANARVYLGGASVDVGGSLLVKNLGLNVVVVISFNEGIDFDVDAKLRLEALESDLTVNALGTDYSSNVNDFLNNNFTTWLTNNANTINLIVGTLVDIILEYIHP